MAHHTSAMPRSLHAGGGFVAKKYRSERSNIMDIKPDQQTAHESVRDQARVGRFSAGVEVFADSSDKLHRGRFSEGLEHLPRTGESAVAVASAMASSNCRRTGGTAVEGASRTAPQTIVPVAGSRTLLACTRRWPIRRASVVPTTGRSVRSDRAPASRRRTKCDDVGARHARSERLAEPHDLGVGANLRLKSAPPVAPPFGMPVSAFWNTCSTPRNLTVSSVMARPTCSPPV